MDILSYLLYKEKAIKDLERSVYCYHVSGQFLDLKIFVSVFLSSVICISQCHLEMMLVVFMLMSNLLAENL